VAGRYHISTKPAPPGLPCPARFRLGEGDDYVKYGHAPFEQGRRGGDAHWTAEIISQIWYQAETGRIPISGAGYGGAFSGPGFDAIWLDMSEIVRPTRDGIHGREHISTAVVLGCRPSALQFDAGGRLVSELPPQVEIPIPVLFDPPPLPLPGHGAQTAAVRAAARLGTLALVRRDDWTEALASYGGTVAPLLNVADDPAAPWVQAARLVEIEVDGQDTLAAALAMAEQVQAANPRAVAGLRLPLTSGSLDQVERLAGAGIGLLHLAADEAGCELAGGSPRFLTDVLQEAHHRLVAASLRDQVALVVSGGIAAAEHVPKALACGADAVALIVALGCALWADVRRPCPVEDLETDVEWGAQRLVNLMAAWRDQLLEVLGAMGLREVCRLRGELGRVIFQPKEEAAFRSLFGRHVSGHPAAKPPTYGEGELEGDLRWPTALILATAEQARTGRPPATTSGLDVSLSRAGRSGGGFDRLRFGFELDGNRIPGNGDSNPQPLNPGPQVLDQVDLSLDLNRRDPARPRIRIPHPWYGAGMSFGSVSLQTMLARAGAAQFWDSFTSTGEGGYPDELLPYAAHIITQIATGLFGVREDTIQRARIVEFKYAQGAKPGLGGHLLGSKVTPAVAAMREVVESTSLFSPFPFHSVYSVEDHKKHLDWIRLVNPSALLSVKVSTPTDVDMVAVGSYYAGAHIIHLDGAYGGTGAAPEIAKKNIAMPLEYAIPKVHRFLEAEGIRDEVVIMASGGVRTAFDVAKAIALGADGCVIGTAELVALGCMRLGTCERDKGCPLGIATTDPELARQIDPQEGGRRIANLYASWRVQLATILHSLGLQSVQSLRGRSDLLAYLE
jgi:glutamate synthase domain-containing protein 2